MNNRSDATLSNEQIEALLDARYEDAFSVLGMHRPEQGSGLIVRALLPGALEVDVLSATDNKKVATLQQVHEAGYFEGRMGRRSKPFHYRLRVSYAHHSVDMEDPYRFPSLLSDDDLYLFNEGTQEQVYRWMGAHPRESDGVAGTLFVVWAPDASRVSVVGDFNAWDGRRHVMRKHPASGVWEMFVPDIGAGTNYKYEIRSRDGHVLPLKADPYACYMQHPPETASITVSDEPYAWSDDGWLAERASSADHYQGPVSIYEVHLGSWRRKPEEDNRYLTYRELADELIPYTVDMGFTHLQLMPVTEYPFDGSWGYQPIGMYAPTCRFGTPDDFRYFVNACHQAGIGLLLDWVPGHFPTDEHGLGRFDGTCLYEHEDLRKGFHPDWNTLIYNYGRAEVKSYLIGNAMYWMKEFHVDGLRVDAVASMLYLDYSREEGQWIPNEQGGRENLEAIELLKQVNNRVYFNHPGAMMVAEESTAWPGVSRPTDQGGLGFGFKWNMGWMNDSLEYMARDPVHRKYHHNEITFSLVYSFSENFILPLSHDEVVHGKGSLIDKMPGDTWQKFANLRAYYAFMWTHPGKKLLFMGCEFAQGQEWNHNQSLDWHLLDDHKHLGIQQLIKDLNRTYRELPALHERDCDGSGFEWVESNDHERSVLAFLRKGSDESPPVLVVVNFTPTPHPQYRVGVPGAGHYAERLNTDSNAYGGTNMGNSGGVTATPEAWHGRSHSVEIAVPPLATLIFELEDSDA